MINQNIKNQKGTMLVATLSITALFIVIFFGAISLALMQQKLNLKKISHTQALHIAEAGINYYRWVLYHDSDEYCNKETCQPSPNFGPYGPYSYTNQSGTITGEYELYITPPPTNGSTIVKIKSVGWMSSSPNMKRTVEVNCGIKSWSNYSVLSNSDVNFGVGTEIWGEIHSNNGIRFDGVAHNIVSSSLLDYSDPDHSDPNEFAVHTHTPLDPYPDGNNPPENVPSVPAVFMAGREFPKTVVSFDLLDNYANDMLIKAQTDGLVVAASGAEGYHVTLKTDDTIDIRIINSLTPYCRYKPSGWKNVDTLGIASETDFSINTPTPNNGIIFIKDHVWIDGQINSNRITILAFEEPLGGNVSDITINNDLLYTNYDGTDAIGLIAQRNINIGLFSDDNLQIDAALIAKEGRIGRYYYPCIDTNDCSSTYCTRNKITINGALATREHYGFVHADGSGYTTRVLNFDNNLVYTPPPHYPTTGEYTFISWYEE